MRVESDVAKAVSAYSTRLNRKERGPALQKLWVRLRKDGLSDKQTVQEGLRKGRVRAHTRRLKSGKVILVREYIDKRASANRHSESRKDIAEQSYEYGAGLFWRVHRKGARLDPEAVSWPWGMTREEAEELDLVLPGVSCMSNPEELVAYWEDRGGVDDRNAEVVVFRGKLLDAPDEGDVAVPERELFRIPYSRVKAAVDADDYSLLDDPPPSTASGSPPTRGRRLKHVRDHRQPLRPVRRPPRGGVVDALAEKGRGNNYLAYDKSLRSPKAPYPQGKEREALKEAFDGLSQKAYVKAHTRRLKSGKEVP